jgi:3-oxoacyl-[acyl-carrier protein] reductase
MIKNKTVLITGGNKGIGLAATEKFLNAGNTVIVVARNFNNFKFKSHPSVETIEFDVRARQKIT